jgi:hypothetical protein
MARVSRTCAHRALQEALVVMETKREGWADLNIIPFHPDGMREALVCFPELDRENATDGEIAERAARTKVVWEAFHPLERRGECKLAVCIPLDEFKKPEVAFNLRAFLYKERLVLDPAELLASKYMSGSGHEKPSDQVLGLPQGTSRTRDLHDLPRSTIEIYVERTRLDYSQPAGRDRCYYETRHVIVPLDFAGPLSKVGKGVQERWHTTLLGHRLEYNTPMYGGVSCYIRVLSCAPDRQLTDENSYIPFSDAYTFRRELCIAQGTQVGLPEDRYAVFESASLALRIAEAENVETLGEVMQRIRSKR